VLEVPYDLLVDKRNKVYENLTLLYLPT